MKKILLIFLLFMLPLSALAKEKYEFKGGILYNDGKKVTGTFELIFEKYKAKGSFVNGLPDGIFERYYPDGSIMLKNTFVAGIRMTEETYYKSGKLFIKFSKKDNSLKVFYEDGNLVLSRNIKTDSYIIYHENGKPLMVFDSNVSTLYNENNEILFKLNSDESLDSQGDLKELKDGSYQLVKNNKVIATLDASGTIVTFLYSTGEPLMRLNDNNELFEVFFKNGNVFFETNANNFKINYKDGKPLYKTNRITEIFFNRDGEEIPNDLEKVIGIRKIK
ncbi:toxin-antitoxin system YwqK family antitoxin [Fusobacterium pseudoperiodonticum]|uniref:toxin-antitoxin system YwqK family antitoxin n=1 Tax=Fusobacterium pseudoperiodonticum TaxID=2663009 RepID=UPI0028EF135A|nr:toxin-antitoxin system YwqK family antitoxin [Fusobacterium pseudoperiodonticum]